MLCCICLKELLEPAHIVTRHPPFGFTFQECSQPHSFHPECIRQWLRPVNAQPGGPAQENRNVTCPCCRATMYICPMCSDPEDTWPTLKEALAHFVETHTPWTICEESNCYFQCMLRIGIVEHMREHQPFPFDGSFIEVYKNYFQLAQKREILSPVVREILTNDLAAEYPGA